MLTLHKLANFQNNFKDKINFDVFYGSFGTYFII